VAEVRAMVIENSRVPATTAAKWVTNNISVGIWRRIKAADHQDGLQTVTMAMDKIETTTVMKVVLVVVPVAVVQTQIVVN
jgi:hypothetical protein